MVLLFTFLAGTLNALWQNLYEEVILTNDIDNCCFSEAMSFDRGLIAQTGVVLKALPAFFLFFPPSLRFTLCVSV